MTLSFTNPDTNKDFLINKFLRDFKQHDYVWIAWNVSSNLNYSPRNLLDFFNKKNSFDSLKNHIKGTLCTLKEDDINVFIQSCYQKNDEYILDIDVNLFLSDNRLCWFLINRFLSNYNIYLFTRLKSFNQFNNSEIHEDINNHETYYQIPDSVIHRNNNKSKNHKYINNPKIIILALIYLNPKITKNIYQKKIDLENFIIEFNEIKKEKINLNKYINDKDFLKWSKCYIDKHFKHTVFPKFSIEKDNLLQEYTYAYFDDLYVNNKEKYINDLNKLKKAWQQNIFRIKNKDNPKKSYHLPLKKGSKKLLEELALFKKLSETEVLEKLIIEAYKNEMCNEKGKADY